MQESKVTGVVHVVEDSKTYGQRGFRKRLVVLMQDDGRFTNYIPVEFVQDSCEMADQLNVGDEAEVTYRLSGRRWQRDERSEVKYFLSAEALELKVLSRGADGDAGDAGGGDAGGGTDQEFAPTVEPEDDPIPF